MRSDRALAGLLLVTGLTHFLRPEFYDAIVPGWVPGTARTWTYGSGAAELAIGVALLLPRQRRRAAYAAVVLFVVVFPANVKMALDGGHPDASGVLGTAAVAWVRLPLQVPLIWWALTLARPERTASPSRSQNDSKRT
jgi:uncharacterized membrane protein